MNQAGWLGLAPMMQFGVVVDDLDQAIERDLARRPDAEWKNWTYGPQLLAWQRIDGQPAAYELDLAVSGTDPQLEYVQPGHGDTSLSRRLQSHGPGLHHVGIIVSDFEKESARLRDMGIRELEAGGGHGLDGDGAFGYFDTTALCGVLIELIQPPARRPSPRRVLGQERSR